MALIESKQSGSTVLDSDSTDTNITISAVNLSRALVRVTLRTPSDEPAGTALAYDLTSTTNLWMRLEEMGTANVYVEWEVIEFTVSSGITVQRGDYTTGSVTISTVDVTDSHVEMCYHRTGGTWGSDDVASIKIVSSTSMDTWNGNSETKYYQVVDWNGHAEVQHVDFTMTETAEDDITISSVDDEKIAVIASSSFSANIYGEDICALAVTTATNLKALRQGGNLSLTVRAQVIEFLDAETLVQVLDGSIAAASTSDTVTITTVDTDKTTIMPGSSLFWFGAGNQSNDDAGNFALSYDQASSTSIELERSDSSGSVWGYFSLIEFDTALGNPWNCYAQQ